MKSHYLDYRDSMMIEVSHENSVDVFAQSDSVLDYLSPLSNCRCTSGCAERNSCHSQIL